MMEERQTGLVHIYCGDGKGKTSAAVGLAVRAAGRGLSVVIVRFLKTDGSGEVAALKKIPNITVLPCKKSFGFVPGLSEEERKEAEKQNRELFFAAARMAKKADVLVLDEIMAAVGYGMISETEVLDLLRDRPRGLEVVMTGRDPSGRLLAAADYVSEIKNRAHPYGRGITARIGIEY